MSNLKHSLLLALPLLSCMSVASSYGESAPHGKSLEESYFEDQPSGTLTIAQKKTLKLAEDYNRKIAVAPTMSEEGSIEFTFGAQRPTIVCAPFEICDIALEPGERNTSKLHAGDTVRWQITTLQSGNGDKTVEHVIIKPLEPGLDTSLVIPTNRRIYHLELKSTRSDYMPFVSFYYLNEENENQGEQNSFEVSKELDKPNAPVTEPRSLENLDFNYEINGDAPWKPLRVFNDGEKTFIQLPATSNQANIPNLFVKESFSSHPAIVNERFKNHSFVLDGVFDHIILVLGVGWNQQKVVIKKIKPT